MQWPKQLKMTRGKSPLCHSEACFTFWSQFCNLQHISIHNSSFTDFSYSKSYLTLSLSVFAFLLLFDLTHRFVAFIFFFYWSLPFLHRTPFQKGLFPLKVDLITSLKKIISQILAQFGSLARMKFFWPFLPEFWRIW